MRIRLIAVALMTLIIIAVMAVSPADAVRLKDIATFEGVRPNQIIGYGLVVGLNGTGDKTGTTFTVQSLTNMLKRMGLTVPANQIRVKNVAAVMVTADMPPFVKPGSTIDVLVSSLGDSSSPSGRNPSGHAPEKRGRENLCHGPGTAQHRWICRGRSSRGRPEKSPHRGAYRPRRHRGTGGAHPLAG